MGTTRITEDRDMWRRNESANKAAEARPAYPSEVIMQRLLL